MPSSNFVIHLNGTRAMILLGGVAIVIWRASQNTRQCEPVRQTPQGMQAVVANNLSLLNTGKYSDLTLKCKGREFKVHKSIVCSQCKPFAASMHSWFIESKTGVINLVEDDPEIVRKLLEFLYTGSYRTSYGTWLSMDNAERVYINNRFMMEAVKVYILAEKYDVQPLKLYALKNFQLSLSKGYVVELDNFVACITLMYTETPDSDRRLKDATMDWVSKQGLEIVERIMIPFCDRMSGGSADGVGVPRNESGDGKHEHGIGSWLCSWMILAEKKL